MRIAPVTLIVLSGLASAATPIIVDAVKLAVSAGDFNLAQRELKQFRDAKGSPSEYLEALSWLGRGDLAARNFAAAETNAIEVRKLCIAQLTHRKLDAEASLPTALGASIEVQALAATAQGRRDEAVVFLRGELRRWGGTSICNRIQKNLNLLTLEGKPAPPLVLAQSVTSSKLLPLAAHRGHPVLLFFWAHWCSDCKQEIAIIRRIEDRFGPAGLVVVAPTQHYGYVAAGTEAPRATETGYIRQVWQEYYAGLGAVGTPLSEQNFANYGVSTSPTLVLLDRAGIVRLYNPGALTEERLAALIPGLLH